MVSCVCSVMLQIGCKNSDTPDSSLNSEVQTANPVVDNSLRTIKQNSLEFKPILESQELQSILAGFDTPIKQVQTDENGKDISSYIITMEADKGIQRDIFITTKKYDQELFIVPFIRLHNVTSLGTNSIYLGKVKWFAADGTKLNEMTIKDNKVSNFSIKDINSKTARAQECKWLCTYQQFNAAYMNAKNECEKDWLCDFACSFNPCAVSYTISAVRYCSSCYPTLNGVKIPKLTREDIGNLTINW